EEGIRKPDPRVYELACKRLGVLPAETVYLDDLGINLKPARALGMQTIKVLSEAQAITDLEAVLGIRF
ncbi:MAG: HAD-IA family hydrolase, partial [Gammaproteobacteria bacterium]